ncbi:hypothetical protein [Streptomyces sp. TRM68416]|uniref:hypothetical protein n=1 Tax=Streptomyces sp. TRM68416 TaxID=2758412 RepID=UPI0016620AC9|nr:hypothetical protein [Streptomyces sp. TRM68416]MBD0837379.1 hypothetical protein [Streptomyces sp. TRM68416]
MVKIAKVPQVLLAVEVAFVLVFLAGVGMVYVPAALILGGVLGVVVVERQMARHTPAQARGKGRET